MNKLFVYGTLLDENVRFELFNEDVRTEKVVLENYTIIPYYLYTCIEYCQDSNVIGKILYLTDEQLSIVDEYENVPYLYVRDIIEIDNDKVFVYLKGNISNE